MAESLAACVYTGPDGSKQARGKDTNSVFSEGLHLEFCFALHRRSSRVLGTNLLSYRLSQMWQICRMCIDIH